MCIDYPSKTTNTVPPPPPPRPSGGSGGVPPPPPPPPKKSGIPSPPPPPPRPSSSLSPSVEGHSGGAHHNHHHQYHPELKLLQGLGPFTDIHLIIASLVGHDKSQIFIEKHVQRGEGMDMFLLPWDDGMDTDREFRVFVDERSRVAAIAPWNPFGTYPTTKTTTLTACGDTTTSSGILGTNTTSVSAAATEEGDTTATTRGGGGGATRDADTSRVAFPWVEALTDADLKHLAIDIASYVEERIMPKVLAHTPFKSCTVDVLVREVMEVNPSSPATPSVDDSTAIPHVDPSCRNWAISLVETGPFGPFMHAGSTLYHWLEEDVFDKGCGDDDVDDTIDMRVLTDYCKRGEQLSVTKPVRKPDLFE